jgi:hypothetical protein
LSFRRITAVRRSALLPAGIDETFILAADISCAPDILVQLDLFVADLDRFILRSTPTLRNS